MRHQIPAARRVAASLDIFGGSLLCDAVGLGKTYVALGVATRYASVVVVVPSVLRSQWHEVAGRVGLPVSIVTHESLSRRGTVPTSDLVIVDEAHRFRNPGTIRYDRLARSAGNAHVLLLTATPVVNSACDVLALIRLFLCDHALAPFAITSLEQASEGETATSLGRALTPLMVARTVVTARIDPGSAPIATDGDPIEPAPARDADMATLTRSIETLEFPSFAQRTAAELLRLHAYRRLSSSIPALTITLRRHLSYLDRAIRAACRGEALHRREARVLFDLDNDLQLELDVLYSGMSAQPLDPEALRSERARIEHLLRVIRSLPPANPKAAALEQITRGRGNAKTLIFTNAVETALDLACRLDWKRAAVVTGRGARIASGPIATTDALSLFAPISRGSAPPPRHADVDLLIATDLVSEGLNLQDADGVVHYDLPWTPLRLQQRVGRVSRLGSPHARVHVWWFRPAPILEERLSSGSRIDDKVAKQLEVGVAVSSRLGRSSVLGRAIEHRERLASHSSADWDGEPGHAFVVGPAAAAFVLHWTLRDRIVPEVVVLKGPGATEVNDLGESCRIIEALTEGAVLDLPAPARPDHRWTQQLSETVRARLGAVLRGPVDLRARQLSRLILASARREGFARHQDHVTLLDAALQCVSAGLREGAVRELRDALRPRIGWKRLAGWLAEQPAGEVAAPSVVLVAAIIGNGSSGHQFE